MEKACAAALCQSSPTTPVTQVTPFLPSPRHPGRLPCIFLFISILFSLSTLATPSFSPYLRYYNHPDEYLSALLSFYISSFLRTISSPTSSLARTFSCLFSFSRALETFFSLIKTYLSTFLVIVFVFFDA